MEKRLWNAKEIAKVRRAADALVLLPMAFFLMGLSFFFYDGDPRLGKLPSWRFLIPFLTGAGMDFFVHLRLAGLPAFPYQKLRNRACELFVVTQYQNSVFGYKSGSSTSLEELEAEVISSKHFELANVPSVQSIEDITSQEAKDALEYVQNTDNGLFIPTASNLVLYYSPKIQYQARRYIYGYPTTETVRIWIDKAEYSESKFTKEDLAELVDLEPAITAVKEAFGDGNIHPPHIADAQSVEIKEHFIFGWYCKGKDGVYGIIRLTFRYVGGYDDAYFIVTGDSKEPQQINRNSLLELVGTADDYIYLGDYNSEGMTQLGHYG